jgi:hypothetical protein
VNVPRYSGIDSDATWVANARDGSPDRFRFYFADVGNLAAWGTAAEMNKNFLSCQMAPLVVEKKAFDVYMVDSRWRVPCALLCMLHTLARNGGIDNYLVLIRDFVDKERSIHCSGGLDGNCKIRRIRRAYHRVKEVADLVDHSGNELAISRRKQNVADEDIFGLWKETMSG